MRVLGLGQDESKGKLSYEDLPGSHRGRRLFRDLPLPDICLGAPELSEQLTAATGIDFTVEEIMKIGERIWNMERLFLLANGFTKADDTLPPRILKEPVKVGPCKGAVSKLDVMLPEYYEVRGWDAEGRPTPEKLQELGLQ